MLTKALIKSWLLEALAEQIRVASMAADQAQATASHEQNRPENQYDTLSLEASYLAHGQSMRIAELQAQYAQLKHRQLPQLSEHDEICEGALIGLQCVDHETCVFVLVLADMGAWQFEFQGAEVRVLNAKSPLAKQLIGLGLDDELIFPSVKGTAAHRVISLI